MAEKINLESAIKWFRNYAVLTEMMAKHTTKFRLSTKIDFDIDLDGNPSTSFSMCFFAEEPVEGVPEDFCSVFYWGATTPYFGNILRYEDDIRNIYEGIRAAIRGDDEIPGYLDALLSAKYKDMYLYNRAMEGTASAG